jgi:hypothetical protein
VLHNLSGDEEPRHLLYAFQICSSESAIHVLLLCHLNSLFQVRLLHQKEERIITVKF